MTEEQARRILAVGRRYAHRRQVPPDQIDDCSLDFYVSFVQFVCRTNLIGAGNPIGSSDHSVPLDFVSTSQTLCRMADNHAYNHCRREKRYRDFHAVSLSHDSEMNPPFLQQISDPAPGPQARVLLAEARAAVLQALETLPAIDREIFVQHYVYERSLRDLAEQHGMTYAAIKFRIAAIRKRLRARLEPIP